VLESGYERSPASETGRFRQCRQAKPEVGKCKTSIGVNSELRRFRSDCSAIHLCIVHAMLVHRVSVTGTSNPRLLCLLGGSLELRENAVVSIRHQQCETFALSGRHVSKPGHIVLRQIGHANAMKPYPMFLVKDSDDDCTPLSRRQKTFHQTLFTVRQSVTSWMKYSILEMLLGREPNGIVRNL
jgi:hypothetical protein